jgi:DNA mismatch repair protein MutS
MYDDYIREYKHYSHQYGPKTAILMLVGAFYELYDVPDQATGCGQTSMKDAIDTMGIQLKVKEKDHKGQDAWFGGFRQEQLHKFAQLLTRRGWTVIVMNQTRDSRGRIERQRQVVRILSPGTHVEASGSDALFLGGLWLEAAAWSASASSEPPTFGAVAMDLTTGSVSQYAGQASGRRDVWGADDLLHFFQVHPPRELIVWWRGDALDQPTEQGIRRLLGLAKGRIQIQSAVAQKGLDKALVREELLRAAFQPKTMLPLRELLGLASSEPLERALTALVAFAKEHHPSAVEHLPAPHLWSPEASMALGNHALTQLNMTMANEEDSVLGMFLRTTTPMGRRAMRERLLYPKCQVEELRGRLAEVTWWKDTVAATKEQLLSSLRTIQDLPRLHRRITNGCVNIHDVLALDQSYVSIRRLAGYLKGGPLEMTTELATGLATYEAAFHAVFDIEKGRTGGAGAGFVKEIDSEEDAFCLQDSVAPGVTEVEEQIAGYKRSIQELIAAFVAWMGPNLGEAQLRPDPKEAHLFLAGAKGVMTRIAKEIKERQLPPKLLGAHVSTKVAGGRLEIPELQKLYMAVLTGQQRLAAAVRLELPELCDELAAAHTETWVALEEWVARADVTGTLARVAEERGYVCPEIVDSTVSSIDVEGLRHPLIEAQQSRTEYVRHTVALGASGAAASGGANGWLIYGMNASGKSSLMKAVGIAVLLAQAGSFVPAARLRLSPFRSLFTRILNTDNLWAGLSSFAVEMTELREILRRADAQSLVLGDEVCSGTESTSATALVAATLRWFERRDVRYMFATHLHGLQSIPELAGLRGMKTWHLRVRYDAAADRLVYERTLHPGAGSSLYGLEVARAMALPFELLESAQQIRRQLLGTATENEAPASEWNTAVVRRACELCSADIVRDLEVHHIQPRASATGGRLADGSSMNAVRNLVVVCQGCHDKHHAGQIEIGPVQQTSDGPVRQVMDLSQYAYKAPVVAGKGCGLAPEDLAKVEEYLRKYPTCAPKRLVFDLEQREGIKITTQRLATIRAKLTS